MKAPVRLDAWMKNQSAPTKKLGAPFIARILRNEWDATTLAFRNNPKAFWSRSAQALLLAVAVCFSLGATDSSSRYNDLNHRLMCTCGCAQLLGECNHVGCPSSGAELNELSGFIATGMNDKAIFAAFTSKYGATVLAAPTTQGFDLVAWIAPFAVFAAALLGTILLIRRWAGIAGLKAQAAALEPVVIDPADRERREQIRRETGSENGF